jgi:hypothetical protein
MDLLGGSVTLSRPVFLPSESIHAEVDHESDGDRVALKRLLQKGTCVEAI